MSSFLFNRHNNIWWAVQHFIVQLTIVWCHHFPLTYLLTPWCRVLLEKLTSLQLVKKFPAFHGTRRFITVLTSVRHLSLSWASPIQSLYTHPTSWRSILILSPFPSTTQISPSASYSQKPSAYFPPSVWETMFNTHKNTDKIVMTMVIIWPLIRSVWWY